VILAASAARSPSAFEVVFRVSDFMPDFARRRSDITYFRPFREPVPSRRPTGALSRAASPGDGVSLRCDFGCFGFFASRFDRFWPFAIAGSLLLSRPSHLRSIRGTDRYRTGRFRRTLNAAIRRCEKQGMHPKGWGRISVFTTPGQNVFKNQIAKPNDGYFKVYFYYPSYY
jgi:hypothetical protein